VNTLLAVRKVDQPSEELAALTKKYLTGDLGDGMSADLNYALKRLIRGLSSENHAVKQGYYLATAQVLSRFKKQIDSMKLLKFVTEETKVSKGMKQPEIHAQTIAKLMCTTAVVESQLYQVSPTQINHDAFNKIANDLIQTYKDHDYCRESVQVVLAKLLRNVAPLNHGAKLLERIAVELIADWKTFVWQHADNLGFYLQMRAAYLDRYVGQLRENEHVYENQIFSSENSYKKLSKILS
jgi:hypothetical protein